MPNVPTLLVVEDEPDLRSILAEFFASRGYRVLQAANGLEALEALHANGRVDLILLDLLMPEMDGVRFLREIRGDGSTVPVLVVSAAHEVPPELSSCFPAAVLRKPVSPMNLLRAVDACLSG